MQVFQPVHGALVPVASAGGKVLFGNDQPNSFFSARVHEKDPDAEIKAANGTVGDTFNFGGAQRSGDDGAVQQVTTISLKELVVRCIECFRCCCGLRCAKSCALAMV
jgi:hypothetical protein